MTNYKINWKVGLNGNQFLQCDNCRNNKHQECVKSEDQTVKKNAWNSYKILVKCQCPRCFYSDPEAFESEW